MDGKGRYLDNIYIERFWRTLKYEEVYLKSYDSVAQARQEISSYITWYNTKRRHQGLGYIIPSQAMERAKDEKNQATPGLMDNGDNLEESYPHYPQILQLQPILSSQLI